MVTNSKLYVEILKEKVELNYVTHVNAKKTRSRFDWYFQFQFLVA